MSEVTIRRLAGRDMNAYVDLVLDGFREELAWSGMSEDAVRMLARSGLAAGRAPVSWVLRRWDVTLEIWVAVSGEVVAGTYALIGKEPVAVTTVAVRGDHRGQGIGRLLMEHAVARARALDRRAVALEVLKENEHAVRLYRSIGMTVYDQRSTYTAPTAARRAENPGPVRLGRLTPSAVRAWPEVFPTGVPSEAVPLEALYKQEYVGQPYERWLQNFVPVAGGTRHAVVLNGVPSGFARVRPTRPGQPVEVGCLYGPAVASHAGSLVCALLAQVGASRLYLSETQHEAREAARALGFAYERTWLYMYRPTGDAT